MEKENKLEITDGFYWVKFKKDGPLEICQIDRGAVRARFVDGSKCGVNDIEVFVTKIEMPQ